MKNFTKVFMTLYMLTLIAVPVAGNTLPHEPITPEPGISTCSIKPDPSQSIIEDDDLEAHD